MSYVQGTHKVFAAILGHRHSLFKTSAFVRTAIDPFSHLYRHPLLFRIPNMALWQLRCSHSRGAHGVFLALRSFPQRDDDVAVARIHKERRISSNEWRSRILGHCSATWYEGIVARACFAVSAIAPVAIAAQLGGCFHFLLGRDIGGHHWHFCAHNNSALFNKFFQRLC